MRSRNPWVRFIMEHWWLDTITWETRAEAASNGWATELREYAETHPRPRLKDYMVGLSDTWRHCYRMETAA